MTGSGWFDAAGVAWETYSFKQSLGSGKDEFGRTYAEFEVEDPNGELLYVRMMTAPAPNTPVNPIPSNDAQNVDRNVVLQWDDVVGADGYEVWFGSDSATMTKVATTSSSHYDTGLPLTPACPGGSRNGCR